MAEEQEQKMLRTPSLLELTASFTFPPHSKDSTEAIVSNLKWFQLNVTLHLKGNPARIVHNTTMLPLRIRLVTENGLPIKPPDGVAPSIRFKQDNDTVHVINGSASVSIGIHKSINSDNIGKQRMRIEVTAIPCKTLTTHTSPFKVMVKVDRPGDRPQKRKAEALTESPLSTFASYAVSTELCRRCDEHASAIEELKEGQRAICTELAELRAAIRGDNN